MSSAGGARGPMDEAPFASATNELMTICPRCGAMVGLEDRHREWHKQLAELVRAIEVITIFGS